MQILIQKRLVIIVLLCLVMTEVWAQKKRQTVEQYINKYKAIAISEMERSQVPASITLAQGILESASGNSYLARKARNHFGIKCHRSWKGKRIYAHDDRARECFRKYDKVSESYEDHSNFLDRNNRYSFLFNGELVDYKAWAKGLKKAGYATDPKYAAHLIKLIERYNLDRFDFFIQKNSCDEVIVATTAEFNGKRTVLFNCDITPEHIEQSYGIKRKELITYNSKLRNKEVIPANTIVFLEDPKRKSTWGKKMHRVIKNQTMEDIAMIYGVNVKSLYYRNKMHKWEQPEAGELVVLEGQANQPPRTYGLPDISKIPNKNGATKTYKNPLKVYTAASIAKLLSLIPPAPKKTTYQENEKSGNKKRKQYSYYQKSVPKPGVSAPYQKVKTPYRLPSKQ